jgi:hypothetical protein
MCRGRGSLMGWLALATKFNDIDNSSAIMTDYDTSMR